MTAVSPVSRRTARDVGGGSRAVLSGSVGAGAAPGEGADDGPGRVTAASSIASCAGLRIGGPPSRACPDNARQVTESMAAGRPGRTWPGRAIRPPGRGAGGSAARPSPGQYPVSAAYSSRARPRVSAWAGSAACAPVSAATIPQAGDRDLAARAAPQAGRGETQVREPGLVRDGQPVSGLGDHAGRLPGIERARREHVGQAPAGRPSGDDERALRAIIGIENPGQPRIADPAHGTGGRHDPGYVMRFEGEDAYRHRAGQPAPHQARRVAGDRAALRADHLATAGPGTRIPATPVAFYGRTAHVGAGDSHADRHPQLAL